MKLLPFHCPTFRTDHLLEPCTKNLGRVKALKEAKKHIGPLELCVECKGKMLITAPLPNKSLEEGRLSTEEEALDVHPAIPVVKPYRQDWEPHSEVTTAPLFLKDAGTELVMRQLSPEKIAAGRAAGHNLGKKYKKREKILPELPKKQEEIVPEATNIVQVKPEVLEQRMLEGKVPAVKTMPTNWGIEVPPETQVGARYCPTHPEVLQRVDKLGRWMGMCNECLSDRGKKFGEQNFERGVTAPPVSIQLNMPKYAELKEWLVAQAEENERTLGQQIMFILKMAWRQGI